MLDKYGNQGLVILAVNVEAADDDAVLPFIRNMKYGFIPLKGGGRDWDKSGYKVMGTPTNFLIDGRGRLMFKQRASDPDEERTMELEIEALLETSSGSTQPATGAAAARAEMDRGKAAAAEKQWDEALASFRKAIDLDPTFFDAHQLYVATTRRQMSKAEEATAKLQATYGEWVSAQPKNAVLHYFLGTFESDPDKADQHFLRAIELDPKFQQPYGWLAGHAVLHGDNARARAFRKRAADNRPDDAGAAYDYADSFKLDDLNEWKRLTLAAIERFPTDQRTAEALYCLGEAAETEAESIRYLERVRHGYPPAKYPWSINASELLFEIYSTSEPAKAVAVARDILASAAKSGWDWKKIAGMGEALVKARDFTAARKGAEALAVLDAVEPPQWVRLVPLHIAKADAERAMRQPERAYDRLAGLVASSPNPDLSAALLDHARGLNRSPAQVRADLNSRRVRQAKPAEELRLENYFDSSTATLARYRGQVVLLNFWHPG